MIWEAHTKMQKAKVGDLIYVKFGKYSAYMDVTELDETGVWGNQLGRNDIQHALDGDYQIVFSPQEPERARVGDIVRDKDKPDVRMCVRFVSPEYVFNEPEGCGGLGMMHGGYIITEKALDKPKIELSVDGKPVGCAVSVTVDGRQCEKTKKRRAKLCDFCLESAEYTIDIAGRAACDECVEAIRSDVVANLPTFELVAMLAKQERVATFNLNEKMAARILDVSATQTLSDDENAVAAYLGPATILVIPEVAK